MIGVFDSGVGGYCAFRELRRLLPREDMVYLADRKNAPYGTKSEDEIIAFTKANIKRLREIGARKILIACCTASSVYNSLDEEVSSKLIGEYVMEGLKKLDEVSYIRFASVYKKFQDITTFFDFVNEFEEMLKGGKIEVEQAVKETVSAKKKQQKKK